MASLSRALKPLAAALALRCGGARTRDSERSERSSSDDSPDPSAPGTAVGAGAAEDEEEESGEVSCDEYECSSSYRFGGARPNASASFSITFRI